MSIKIVLLCNGNIVLPAIKALNDQHLLAGVAVPDQFQTLNYPLEQYMSAISAGFLCVAKDQLVPRLSQWLEKMNPDAVCMLGFPYRIPDDVFACAKYGFFNLHSGKLPEYAGADPVFWQLKNMESVGAVTIHQVESRLDAGPVAYVEPVPIAARETYGSYMHRLEHVLPRVLIAFVQQLAIHKGHLPLSPQTGKKGFNCRRPTEADLCIDWSSPVDSIDALVRAGNPLYGGALGVLRGNVIGIVQISKRLSDKKRDVPPGTIIHTSKNSGIVVGCSNGQCVSIDILYTSTGYASGHRFAELSALQPGEQFQDPRMISAMHPVR